MHLSLHLSFLIFLRAQLHDCYLLVVKLLLHVHLLKLHAPSAAPSPYSLSLISQIYMFLAQIVWLCGA